MEPNKTIIKFISGWVNRKRYGINTGILSSQPLLDTYKANSGCDIDMSCIKLKPCIDDVTYKICNTSMNDLVIVQLDYNKHRFDLPTVNNGVAPYEIEWSYDKNYYELVSSTASSITLNRIVEIEFITAFNVKIIDANGCIANEGLNYHFVPVEFLPAITCDFVTIAGNFVTGTPSTGTVTVPFTIQGYGNIQAAIYSLGFTGSSPVTPVVPGIGTISFSINYDGSGSAGNIPANIVLAYGINQSTTCVKAILVSAPVVIVPCSAPRNIDIYEIAEVDCNVITLGSGGTLPDGEVGVPYSHNIVFAGTLPIIISDIVKPSWATVAIDDNTVSITGTPTTVGTGITISFSLDNCHATNYNFTDNINITEEVAPADNFYAINNLTSGNVTDFWGLPLTDSTVDLSMGESHTTYHPDYDGVVGFSTTGTVSGFACLKKNGLLLESLPIEASTLTTFYFIGSFNFVEADMIQILFANTECEADS